MPNNADAIELAEIDMDRLINVMHKQGLDFKHILQILRNKYIDVKIQSEVEEQYRV